jgi:hypothetical protein
MPAGRRYDYVTQVNTRRQIRRLRDAGGEFRGGHTSNIELGPAARQR